MSFEASSSPSATEPPGNALLQELQQRIVQLERILKEKNRQLDAQTLDRDPRPTESLPAESPAPPPETAPPITMDPADEPPTASPAAHTATSTHHDANTPLPSELLGDTPYALECITWLMNRGGAVSRWHTLSQQPSLYEVMSCGFVTYEDSQVVCLTPHLISGRDQGSGDIQIPLGAITNRMEIDLIGEDTPC